MNFFKMFSFCAAVIATGVGCVSADEVVLHLESDVGPRFAYECGYDKKSYNGIGDLACGLDVITNGKLSAVDGSVDLFGDSCDYDIVGKRGECHDLLNFDGFCYSGGLSKITFFGGYKSKPSVRLCGGSDDLQLPIVECRNIPMFHLDEDCPGLCKPSMEHFITNSKTGLEYKYPIRVDGKNCNNAGADICVVAKPGKDLFYYPSKAGNSNIGASEIYIEGLSQDLREMGYWISDISSSVYAKYSGAIVKLADKSFCSSDVVRAANRRCGGVSIDMRGVSQRYHYPFMMKSIGDVDYRSGENGWNNEKNNFCNITLAS